MNESPPSIIVIFGVTGDLARRKLLPALYHLTRDNLLHPETRIIGITRQKLTVDEVLQPLSKYVVSHARTSPAAWRRFTESFQLLPVDLADPAGYKHLKSHLDKINKTARRLYYLSIPPAVVDEVISLMSQAGLHRAVKGSELPAVMVEKPFGYDLESAKSLIRSTRRHFDEKQIYRIDHYLAKEMAQNILDVRFTNPLLLGVWNHEHISKVVITAHETIGIEGRTNFYEQTGALRDLIQSHLLQLLALTAMEPPRVQDSAHIHSQRLKLLSSILPPQPYEVARNAFRGQYADYKRETGLPRSYNETYAAIKLFIPNERWKGVPFILRTGKATHEKDTSIAVHFGANSFANVLTLRLQPDEGVNLNLMVKQPGHGHSSGVADMDFSYSRSFAGHSLPEAYERVLLDAIRGDRTLFATSSEVLAAWRIIQPVLNEWSKSGSGLKVYPSGRPPELRL